MYKKRIYDYKKKNLFFLPADSVVTLLLSIVALVLLSISCDTDDQVTIPGVGVIVVV